MALISRFVTDAILPDCSLALKEWASICDALCQGRQAILIRKGGIVEGPRGFVPEHSHFWLYATHFHQDHNAPTPTHDFVELPGLASIVAAAWIDRLEDLETFRDLHAWDDETIRKRFHYRRPGAWVIAVRVRARPSPWRVPDRPEYRGCVSWVTLDQPYSTDDLVPSMGDGAFHQVLQRLPIGRAPSF